MPRAARLVLPGIPHHVTQRGNRRQPTFFSDADYAALHRAASPLVREARHQGLGLVPDAEPRPSRTGAGGRGRPARGARCGAPALHGARSTGARAGAAISGRAASPPSRWRRGISMPACAMSSSTRCGPGWRSGPRTGPGRARGPISASAPIASPSSRRCANGSTTGAPSSMPASTMPTARRSAWRSGPGGCCSGTV